MTLFKLSLRKKIADTIENDARLKSNFEITPEADRYLKAAEHEDEFVHPTIQTQTLGKDFRDALNAELKDGRKIKAQICMTTQDRPGLQFNLFTPGSARKGWNRKDSNVPLSIIPIPGGATQDAAEAAMTDTLWEKEADVYH